MVEEIKNTRSTLPLATFVYVFELFVYYRSQLVWDRGGVVVRRRTFE